MKMIFALFMACLIGCATTHRDITNISFVKDLASIQPGISKKSDVLKLFGKPDVDNYTYANESQYQYGVRLSSNIKVPQVIISFDKSTEKVNWIRFNNFDETLDLNFVKSHYPNAKFIEVKSELSQYKDYIPSNYDFEDLDIGVSYTYNQYKIIQSLLWSVPKKLQAQKLVSSDKK